MRLLTRVESLGGKCPVCNIGGGSQFFEVSDVQWCCRRCGNVFVPRFLMDAGSGEVVRGLTRDEAREAILAAKGAGVGAVGVGVGSVVDPVADVPVVEVDRAETVGAVVTVKRRPKVRRGFVKKERVNANEMGSAGSDH